MITMKGFTYKQLILSLPIIFLALFSEYALAETTNIYSDKDATISSNYPDNNYGTPSQGAPGSLLVTGFDSGNFAIGGIGFAAALLHFDLSSIPPGEDITQATLILKHAQSSGTDPGDYTIKISNLSQDWQESTVTWNNAPNIGTEIASSTDGYPGNLEIDLTAAVKNWYADSSINKGIHLVRNIPDTGAYVAFWSREKSGSEPTLIVTYGEPDHAPSAWRNYPTESSVDVETGDAQSFTVEASDQDGNLRGAEWYIDGEPEDSHFDLSGSSGTDSWSNTFHTAGTYEVVAKVFDSTSPDNLYSEAVTWTVEVNTPPVLSNGSVDPLEGTTSTNFVYSVDYYDADAHPPKIGQVVVITGNFAYSMALSSGSSSNGTYSTTDTINLESGDHTFYFEFTDGHGGRTRLPATGTFPGPTVIEDPPNIRIYPTTLLFNRTQGESTSVHVGDPTVETMTIPNGLEIRATFTADQLTFWTEGSCRQIFLKGGVLPEDEPGTPWLPAEYINVLIPAGVKVASIKTSADEIVIAEGIDVCPVQPPVPLSAPAPLPTEKGMVAYALNTKVPTKLAEVTGHHIMRGLTYVSIRLNPVRYIPASKELYLAKNLNIKLEFSDQQEGVLTPPSNSGIFKRIVRNLVVNAEMLETDGFAPDERTEILTETIDYLIITSSLLQSTFQTLADHRGNYNGFSTRVVTVESIYQNSSYNGDDDQEEIRNCIEDYVNNKGTDYVVLGGDDTVVPDRDCYVTVTSVSGLIIERNMPTDLYYAGLDSSWDEDGDGVYGEADTSSGDEGDLAPDVIVGRIPVRTTSQALDYIDKLIDYESNPPSEDFRDKFLMLGCRLWNSYTDDNRPSDSLSDGFSGFRDHSPVSDTEMWTRRLYRDRIQPDWEPSTLNYFFDTLTSWDSSTPGDYLQNSSNVSTRFNEGWQHVFFGTHGTHNSSQSYWSLESGGFYSSAASALNGRTTIIYTMACLTGHFDGSTDPSLSEAFLRNNTGGALAYFGCSRFGWGTSDPDSASNTSLGGRSMEYAYEFYDELLNSGEDILGQVFSLHKANLSSSCGSNGSYRWIQFGMNYQGDPAFSLTPKPTSFTIYNDGTGNLEISAITNRDNSPWLSIFPNAPMTISGGESRAFSVTVDATGLSEDTYYDRLKVYSNDPDEPLYLNGVDVNLTVDPETAPPDPDPMTWATEPNAASTTSISMVGTTATDTDSPPVSYFFHFVDSPTSGTGGTDSSWRSLTSYTDTGLEPNHQYGYRVMARDSASTPNETGYSTPTVYKYTYANAPGTAAFSNVSKTAIRANWDANGNRAGTEYYCENTTEGTNSGWTTNTSWDSTGLSADTPYTFRVKAKNGDGIEPVWTPLGTQRTAEPDCTFHSADYNPQDWTVDMSELLRVIQIFNVGSYHCDPSGEDGYAPGPGDQNCNAHKSDYNPQDWTVNMSELLRLIQFFNFGAYHCDPGGEDGYNPGVE